MEERSPTDIAVAFIEARDARDVDATLAVLAPDVAISDIDDDPAAYAARYEAFEITDQRWYVDECTVSIEGPPTRVLCTYTHENEWSRALDVGPFEGGSFNFTIEDGLITSVSHSFNTAQFSVQVWEVFADWVAENHPDDVLRLYRDSSQSRMLTTPEAHGLLARFTDEFVSAQAEDPAAG